MTTTDTALAAESNSADMTPEWMRSLLNRQRTAFAQEGAPAYETRIDRTNRLIALLVDNQDEIVRAVNADYGHRSTEATLLADVWSIIDNYKYTKLHLREWMQTEIHEAMFPDAEARVEYLPKGVVGVVSHVEFPLEACICSHWLCLCVWQPLHAETVRTDACDLGLNGQSLSRNISTRRSWR